MTFPYWSSKHTETAGCRFCSGCYAAEEFRSAGGAPLFRRDCVFLHCSRHGGVAPLDLPATVLLALGNRGGGTWRYCGALTGGACAGGGCGGVHGWRVGISCARCWCDGVRSRPGSRLMDLDLYMESTLNVSLCEGTLSCFSRSAFRSSRFSLYPMFFSSHLALLRFSDSFERMRIFFITRTVAKVMSGRMPGGIGLP